MNPTAPASGLKTTEFITSMIPIALGLFFVVMGMIQKSDTTVQQGMTMLLGGSGIYGVSRGLTKLGHGIGGGSDLPVDAPGVPVPASPAAAAQAIAKL